MDYAAIWTSSTEADYKESVETGVHFFPPFEQYWYIAAFKRIISSRLEFADNT